MNLVLVCQWIYVLIFLLYCTFYFPQHALIPAGRSEYFITSNFNLFTWKTFSSIIFKIFVNVIQGSNSCPIGINFIFLEWGLQAFWMQPIIRDSVLSSTLVILAHDSTLSRFYRYYVQTKPTIFKHTKLLQSLIRYKFKKHVRNSFFPLIYRNWNYLPAT